MPLIAAEIYDHRPDLAQAWPSAHIAETPNGYWRWFCRYGGPEFHVDLLITRFRRCLTSDSLIGFAEEINELMKDQFIAEILPFVTQLNGMQMSSILTQVRDLTLRPRRTA